MFDVSIAINLGTRRNPADLRGQVFIDITLRLSQYTIESIYLLEAVGSAFPASFPEAE